MSNDNYEKCREEFVFVYRRTGVHISGYKGDDTVVTIPDAIGDKRVASIDRDAFDSDMLIHCSPRIFRMLSFSNKYFNSWRYLKGEDSFSDQEERAIGEFLKTLSYGVFVHAIERNDPALLARMFEAGAVNPSEVETYIDMSIKADMPEITALLLKYSGRSDMDPIEKIDLQFEL